jgi:hypothetical protein
MNATGWFFFIENCNKVDIKNPVPQDSRARDLRDEETSTALQEEEKEKSLADSPFLIEVSLYATCL